MKGPLGIGLEQQRSKSAPLPNVGLYGSIKLFGPVALQGNVDAFKLKVGNYKGKLLDGQLGLDYRFAKNFGAGIGYRYAYYKITGDTHNWHGSSPMTTRAGGLSGVGPLVRLVRRYLSAPA